MNPRRSLLACALVLCLPAHAVEYGWISGDYNSGTFPNPLPAGDVVNASGTASKSFSGLTTIAGLLNWRSTANIGMANGALLRVEGRVNVSTDVSFFPVGVGAGVENLGQFVKSAGSGDFSFNAPLTNRSGGVLDAASGRILYRVSSTFDAGTLFTGAGQHVFTSGALRTYHFGGDFAASAETTVRLEGGRFVSAPGSVARPLADLSFASGTLVGAWTVPSGHTLTAADASAGRSRTAAFPPRQGPCSSRTPGCSRSPVARAASSSVAPWPTPV